jgi:hypothetical protein
VALAASALDARLLALFTTAPLPDTTSAAGERWAAAYAGYAGLATAGPALPSAASLSAAEETLAGALAAAFDAATAAGPAGLPTVTALMAAAFAGFWLLPPVQFASPGITGVVTAAAPATLSDDLAAAFTAGQGGSATAAAQATRIAGVLHAWTLTVAVTNATPGGPVIVTLL